MRKFLLIALLLSLSSCVSGQITVQMDCNGAAKQMAAHKDTDQNPTNVNASIPVAVGATPTVSSTATPAAK